MRIAAAAAAAAILVGGAAQAFPSASTTIKDWAAVCDNTGACTAFGFAADDAATPAFLKLERGAGPGATPIVTLVYGPGGAQPAQRWELRVDGAAAPGVGPVAAKGGAGGARAKLTAAQAAALIEALRKGQHLQLVGGGAALADISLAGSAAVLLWIDADQGRVGTVTALAGKGDKAASAIPPAAPEPLVAAAAPAPQDGLPAQAPPGLASGVDGCGGLDPAAPPDDIVARLAPGVVLWGPECAMGGYNEMSVFFLGDEQGGHARRVSLPEPAGASPEGDGMLMNAQFDPKTQTLSSFDKGRDTDDCGSTTNWVWDGKAFELLNETLMPGCHGVTIDDWPLLYVAHRR